MVSHIVHEIVDDIVMLFSEDEVPDNFRFNGQTFRERAIVWLEHTFEQLEEEIETWTRENRNA